MGNALPTAEQLAFLDWEFGVFFHFGIRTFYPGHRDWDGIEMPAEAFAPDALDCDGWVRTAAEAGARYAILTVKHHDGFALWPSAYSRYSVAQTPWRDGKGDVVREFTDACRRHGLKVGLYYSPAQWGPGAVKFTQSREYDDYFLHQITELLTGYGKIDYLWFDGCGSEGHTYDKARIGAEMRRLQPELLAFCDPGWMPGIRWIGNEDGYAPFANPLTFSYEGKPCFQPSECDCRIRDTWFCDDNANSVKSLPELFGMYEWSVGRGANLLLNVGPDAHGRIPEPDGTRLRELGARIRAVYGRPLPFSAMQKNADGTFSITHPAFGGTACGALVNRIVLSEALTGGSSVTGFRLYAQLPRSIGTRVCVYAGETIGHKHICAFPAIRSGKFTLEITGSDGAPALRGMDAFYTD